MAVQNKGKTESYLAGKAIFEKMVVYFEGIEDRKAIVKIDIEDKSDFEEFADSLGI